MKRCWHEHSLTIVSGLFSLACYTAAFAYIRANFGRDVFDFAMNIGHASLSIFILGLLSGPFRERNKPDE